MKSGIFPIDVNKGDQGLKPDFMQLCLEIPIFTSMLVDMFMDMMKTISEHRYAIAMLYLFLFVGGILLSSMVIICEIVGVSRLKKIIHSFINTKQGDETNGRKPYT
ncbi:MULTISPECIES: hypothetical protein [Laceyella]|jgi:hypothetical protein|uniref:Uncharacterized protein n=2 Tax=Laceyella TaxID=292635 RepID=A0ABY5TZL9_LACSH|nr:MULTISPECIES: hypothetical protein [Laceyella]PRZ17159.1 hypothetical protein CLV36_101255 [Laceyella sediminis]UWE02862.1 hypothetical protein NYR52_12065 [Laceyella sacchari]